MNKPNWGGPRKGAGRPALDGATELKETMVMLSPKHQVIALKLGNGNVSLGIRRALDRTLDPRPSTPDTHQTGPNLPPEMKPAENPSHNDRQSGNIDDETKSLLTEAAKELARGGHPKWVELINKIDSFLRGEKP